MLLHLCFSQHYQHFLNVNHQLWGYRLGEHKIEEKKKSLNVMNRSFFMRKKILSQQLMIGNYNKLKLYFESTTPLKGYIGNLPLKQYSLVRELSFASRAGFEITYCHLGNAMHFPLFTIQFFPLTQIITIPKKVSIS